MTHRQRRLRFLPAAPIALGIVGCGHTPVTTSTHPASLAPPATTATASLKAGTYTGQAIDTRYGIVEVGVTVKAGKITAINFIRLPTDRPRSQEISGQAAPLLQSEALQAQTANVNLLSGATYTSEGFAQSLQSALTQAR